MIKWGAGSQDRIFFIRVVEVEPRWDKRRVEWRIRNWVWNSYLRRIIIVGVFDEIVRRRQRGIERTQRFIFLVIRCMREGEIVV